MTAHPVSLAWFEPEPEAFRAPGPRETTCTCDDGLRHWQQDVREGVEVCADCNGSGVIPMEKAA